jgi:hypothetical protein
MMGTQTNSKLFSLLSEVAARAQSAGVFADIDSKEGMLECKALNSAEPADYRVFEENGAIWVSLSMIDRWQSESIESDLVASGDKLNELIEDELDDLGILDPVVTFEHFRSPEMEFVFRSKVPSDGDGYPATELVGTWLLAYEQCFRQLGDIDDTEEDD